MCDDLAGKELLRGFRGAPVVDERRLGEVIALLGAALVATPGLAEIEINPLRAAGDELIALDAVMITAEGGEHAE
jgi:acetyltransferase